MVQATQRTNGRIKVAGRFLSKRNQRLYYKVLQASGTRGTILSNHPEWSAATLIIPRLHQRNPNNGFYVASPMSNEAAANAVIVSNQLNEAPKEERPLLRLDLWRTYAEGYPLLVTSPVYQRALGNMVSAIGGEMPDRGKITMADCGAGTGALTLAMVMRHGLERFQEIWMIEQNNSMLAKARAIVTALFGAEQIGKVFKFVESDLQSVQTEQPEKGAYVKPGLDVVASNLVLPFMPAWNDLQTALKACHAIANPKRGTIVHAVHRRGFNPTAITLQYLWLTLLRERGNLYNVMREVRAASPTIGALTTITRAFTGASESMPSVMEACQWPVVFLQNGMGVHGKPVKIYAKQALLFIGTPT